MVARPSMTPERFWACAHTDESGCLLWGGYKDRFGYGALWFQGRKRLAHRVAWIYAKGHIPEDLCVLHRCDAPACINPEHLFLGTPRDNMNDCMSKGRRKRYFVGEANHSFGKPNVGIRGGKNVHAKLSVSDVLRIRASSAPGVVIAKKFDVSPSAISSIRTRRRWGWV